MDHESKCNVKLGAFQKAFKPSKSIVVYEEVDATTREGVTHACLCLDNPQVLGSSDNSDDVAELHWSIQNANELVIHALTQAGNDSQWIRATLMKRDETEWQITQPNTRA